jgi:hypothetical protein
MFLAMRSRERIIPEYFVYFNYQKNFIPNRNRTPVDRVRHYDPNHWAKPFIMYFNYHMEYTDLRNLEIT